jgi:hypothetical protein
MFAHRIVNPTSPTKERTAARTAAPPHRQSDDVAIESLKDAGTSNQASLRLQSRASLETPGIVQEVLRSPGQPLDAATRAYFEPRFGRDFSKVRVHTDVRAAQSAEALAARAYTVGPDIVFGRERWAPASRPGRHLLAHELTHVVQQGDRAPANAWTLKLSDPAAASESQAQQAADALTAAKPFVLPSPTAPHIARDPDVQRRRTFTIFHRIVDELESSDPDLIDVLTDLGDFRMSDILSTLGEVEKQQSLDKLLGEAQTIANVYEHLEFPVYFKNRDRIIAAIYVIKLINTGSKDVTPDEVDEAIDAISKVTPEDVDEILEYLKTDWAKRGRTQAALEGMSSMLEGPSEPSITLPTATTPAVGAAPPTIEPLPWRWPKGEKSVGRFIGTEAHDAIAGVYASAHPGDVTFYNYTATKTILSAASQIGTRVNPAALSEKEKDAKPDITNLTPSGRRSPHLYEIKTVNSQVEGRLEAAAYVRAFVKAGVAMTLGPITEDGTQGAFPAPGGVFIFESPEAGVIVYRYRRGKLVPVPVRQPQKAGEPRRWRYELQPWQKAAIATATVGVGLIMLMILLAPLGA